MSNTTLLSSLILRPDAAGYDRARAAWNTHADQRPAAVAVAHDVAQVQSAIAYAREHDLRLAPQSTGHFASALPALAGTLLVKLAFDEQVTVDPEARVARV